MSSPYLSQIAIFPFDYAPKGWALCNGQLLPIAQNQALFALLGKNFGGDGMNTFALPNLQGAATIGTGSNMPFASSGGEASHTLSAAETPAHSHTLNANGGTPATSNGVNPGGALLGQSAGLDANGNAFTFSMYNTGNATATLAPAAVATVGGQAHDNHMPSLVLNFCIATSGIYPTRA